MKILIHSFFSQLKRFTLYRKLVLSFMTLLAVTPPAIMTSLIAVDCYDAIHAVFSRDASGV